MENTYLHISITHYNNGIMPPVVYYYRNDGIHPTVSTSDKLTVDEANKLMWELVKFGAKNSYHANWFRDSISVREVTFYGIL